jgi:hypothetical protein
MYSTQGDLKCAGVQSAAGAQKVERFAQKVERFSQKVERFAQNVGPTQMKLGEARGAEKIGMAKNGH